MSKRCYYEVLEVERTADDGALKTSFRKLAMKWHPDRNPGDNDSEHRFKEINEAYDILKDPQRRAAYDRFGHAAFEQGGGGTHGFGSDFGSAFSDIFEGIFGMGGARQRGTGRERGSDLRFNMQITLEEAYKGKTAQVRLPTSVTCEVCSGTGAKAGTKPKVCATCGGHGKIRHSQGFFTLERTCNACHGRGQVIENPCPSCAGSGRTTKERTLSVNIPAGVEDGTRIRLAGEGEAGLRGGPSGDLYIFLSLATHAFFQRDSADLHCRVPISMVTAALGGEFEVPTIDGSQDACENSERHAVRAALPVAGQGHAGAPLQAGRRHVCPGDGRNAAEPDQTAARAVGRVREAVVARNPAGILGFLHQSQGLLRNRDRAGLVPGLTHPLSGFTDYVTVLRRPGGVPKPMPIQALQLLEKKIERQIRLFETRKGIRLDDEVRFIRSWFERPLTMGAISPSGKLLARTMASYVDPSIPGPVIELGPGTGPVTEALVEQGVDPSRLVLIEFNPDFCRLLRTRYPDATVIRGDAYSLRRMLGSMLEQPAAAIVSGLPLVTKPLKTRVRLIREAFRLMQPNAPFVQFTYAVMPPIPKALTGVSTEASERIWMNVPPARVWVYRKD